MLGGAWWSSPHHNIPTESGGGRERETHTHMGGQTEEKREGPFYSSGSQCLWDGVAHIQGWSSAP
jgi:hypothetical protein